LIEIDQIYQASKKILDAHSTEEYREMSNKIIPSGYPEVLRVVAVAAARQLESKGLSRHDALKIGFAVAEQVRFAVGGTKIYIPKGCEIGATETEEKIFREFSGKNCGELAVAYNMSETTIYSIIKRCRKRLKARPKNQ